MSGTLARLNGLRVLVVEDELIIAMELENLLRRLGCIAPCLPTPVNGNQLASAISDLLVRLEH